MAITYEPIAEEPGRFNQITESSSVDGTKTTVVKPIILSEAEAFVSTDIANTEKTILDLSKTLTALRVKQAKLAALRVQ